MIKRRNFWIMLIGDTFLVFLAYYLAYYLRFDGIIPKEFLSAFYKTVFWIVPLKLIFFFIFDLYKGMWRYTSIHDLLNLIKASIYSTAIIVLILVISVRLTGFSRGVFVIDFLLTFLMIGGYRLGVRLYYSKTRMNGELKRLKREGTPIKNLLIIGAGNAGEKLLREILENPSFHFDVVGFVDDNPEKFKHAIHGAMILGPLSNLNKIVKENNVSEIIIAAPSASAAEMRRIVNYCKDTGVSFKTLPSIGELIEGKISVSAVREVRYEDLLGREPVAIEIDKIGCYLNKKKVLVTGGAGSIGSELCRQIAKFEPDQLILLDRNESALYELELELLSRYPGLIIISVLSTIQNKSGLEKIFYEQSPEVVFHAAAYKHVPMMEIHPWEAIFNIILSTQTVLEFCKKYRVERCVIVSTDKAVRPTNVMGASKRVVELLAQAYAGENNVLYMAVRFGNVVGSIGSAVPLFRRQIEAGGPVTVTDPEATRYFMTIGEACSLILQAGAIGNGGEIFILKMGTPIRILDMARDIITLSGFQPEEDIKIKFIGLRPGEKLHEELIVEGEGIKKTQHKDITVLNTNCCRPLTEITSQISSLVKYAEVEDVRGIKETLKSIVPEYEPQL